MGKLLGCGTSGEPSDSGLSICLNPLGDVYLGRDIKTGQDVALKLEPIQTRNPRLYHEHTVYKALANVPGTPAVHWYGREVPYNVLVLDCLGLTLEEVITKCHDINLVFSYANQMLSCLESLHKQSYIHRDIKPMNFMTGIGELNSRVFLINFGLAQLFCDPSTHRHVLLVSGLKIVGTITFTSINSHSGQTQSHRDDLESLVYCIVYLCRGPLPWQDIIKGHSVEQYGASILKKKIASINTLCQGLPAPFLAFTKHIQSLGFDEKPQYDYLHSLLMQCLAHGSNEVYVHLDAQQIFP
ncbi:kinase-like domain-containing protein [Lactarius deliciosus]|nr:kinase-like domain-containing protein [Lactarius deliciosus]